MKHTVFLFIALLTWGVVGGVALLIFSKSNIFPVLVIGNKLAEKSDFVLQKGRTYYLVALTKGNDPIVVDPLNVFINETNALKYSDTGVEKFVFTRTVREERQTAAAFLKVTPAQDQVISVSIKNSLHPNATLGLLPSGRPLMTFAIVTLLASFLIAWTIYARVNKRILNPS